MRDAKNPAPESGAKTHKPAGTAARKKVKKKTEFSKKLVAWALAMTTFSILTSYLLALTDHESCSEITVAVITTCIAIAVSYEAKSYGEKNSRNKYGVDENGRKITRDTTDDGKALG